MSSNDGLCSGLSHRLPQGGVEDGELAVGLEAAEGLLRLQEAGGGPTQRHLGVAPALDVPLHRPDGADRVLDGVGASQRASKLRREAEPDHRQDLVQALQDRARDAGCVMLQTAARLPQEPFGLGRVVLLPGLPQDLPDAGMEALVQPGP